MTDSVGVVAYDENRPGISNLVEMYSVLSGVSIGDVEAQYQGVGYGKFKLDLADLIISNIEPIQSEMSRLLADDAYLHTVMDSQAKKVIEQTAPFMRKIRNAIGLV